MQNEQDILREQVKKAKWQQDKSYKAAAAYIGMSYNAFVNWLHNSDKKLGYTKRQKLKEYLRPQH